jgi:hypothetical protein
MKTILIILVLLFSLSNIEAKDKVKRTAKIERCIEKHKKQVCSFKRVKNESALQRTWRKMQERNSVKAREFTWSTAM